MDGQLVDNVLSGTFVDRSGGIGNFSALDSTELDVVRYCGTFGGSTTGTWNFQRADDVVTGSFAGTKLSGLLEGDVNVAAVNFSATGGTRGNAFGNITPAETATGTWNFGSGSESGTWMATSSTCVSETRGCCIKVLHTDIQQYDYRCCLWGCDGANCSAAPSL